MDRNQLIDNRILNPCCKILSVSEAFCAGCIKPDYLPPVIRIPEISKIRLVLSEKEEFYYKVTSNDWGCSQFDSGIRPCFHQLRALGIFVNRNEEENDQEECLSEEKEESLRAENAKLWIKSKREETEKCRKKEEERKKEYRRRKEENRHKKVLA